MRRPTDRSARCRAVITLAALYGLLLQVFLVSIQPVPQHLSADEVICAAHEGVPADKGTPCPQQLCCLRVHHAQPLAVPVPSAVAVIVPPRLAMARVWHVAERPPVRGPPNRAVSSRGPPAA